MAESKMTEVPKDKEHLLTEVREEYLKIGLSTEPSNPHEAEMGAVLAYNTAGHEFPTMAKWGGPEDKLATFWARSPEEALEVVAVLEAIHEAM